MNRVSGLREWSGVFLASLCMMTIRAANAETKPAPPPSTYNLDFTTPELSIEEEDAILGKYWYVDPELKVPSDLLAKRSSIMITIWRMS